MTVADDLLKNDGQKFLEMMEQLAERRMQREEEAAIDVEEDSEDEDDEGDEDEEDEDEDDEDDEEEPAQNSASARKPKKITALLTFGGAILITLVFLIDLIVLGTTAHNVSGLSKGAATLKFGNAVCAP